MVQSNYWRSLCRYGSEISATCVSMVQRVNHSYSRRLSVRPTTTGSEDFFLLGLGGVMFWKKWRGGGQEVISSHASLFCEDLECQSCEVIPGCLWQSWATYLWSTLAPPPLPHNNCISNGHPLSWLQCRVMKQMPDYAMTCVGRRGAGVWWPHSTLIKSMCCS